MTLIHTPTGAIVCDHMPIGLALVTVRKDGIYRTFVPHRAARPVAAADGDLALDADDVPMSASIKGYERLR